ncbi:30S ribosomal protein S15 [Candidatus Tachikawaea gelatinosa]|uniref:Small ribosomal subunit protein uS15 n=1 Tax=Candidatus Tachikawaea gelatinosa TaxID=1410383 RepID=A0A090ALD0_9ENTR|nr:30S ribosomal protein S15 [Candidatus Tachikawaea gelatinosa]BAP58434.1 30S ribosomal protein S15 [Candidatus Tachikawaea gelatinosa]
MSLSIKVKESIISTYGYHKNDSGSTEVQVAMLTNQINHLKNHFSYHKKDYHSRRGLLRMVSRRRKLLNYLKKTNFDKYCKLIASLKLRH